MTWRCNDLFITGDLTLSHLLTNGSTTFKWKLCCHWLIGLWQYQIAEVIQIRVWCFRSDLISGSMMSIWRIGSMPFLESACMWYVWRTTVETKSERRANYTNSSTSVSTVLNPWWRHQMETFSALLTICAGNSPVSGEFPAQRPVTRSFDVSLICSLNKRLSKQSWGWWFETLSCPLWRQCNGCPH